jgi:adenine-specific DNA-methyltransferase
MKKNKNFGILENSLKKVDKYFDKENNVILRSAISEDADNFNPELLELLLKEKELKEIFFRDIEKVTVFDKDKFLMYVNNKNFLPDSYTKFSQNIGLTEDRNFLKSSGKVVLS